MSEVPFYVDSASIRLLQAHPILHKIFKESRGRRLIVEGKSTVRKPKRTLSFPPAYGMPKTVNGRHKLNERVFVASMKRETGVIFRIWQIMATINKDTKNDLWRGIDR